MKTTWGNVKIFHDKGGSYIQGYTRKRYVRKHPYPKNIIKIKPLPREKAAIIKLRRLGYSINTLSKFLGRSTSFIHRVIKRAEWFNDVRHEDKRKLPDANRKISSKIRWKTLLNYWQKWEAWILGEGDKPP